VLLGFYLDDIQGDENRFLVLQEAMKFLNRQGELPPLDPGVSAAPKAPSETPVTGGPAGGN
jgi:hypothetical protein